MSGCAHTWITGVSLHKFLLRACFTKLGCKPCQLGQDFVNNAKLGSKAVLVDMEG